MGPGRRIRGERIHRCLHAAQRHAQEPSGAWTVITAAVPAPESLASDFTCNYPRDKKDFAHPPSSPSSSLSFYSPSLSTFLLSFHLPNKPHKVHGCREISPKVTFYPGLGLRERESSLSCSLTLSKKAQVVIFPSTFLQTRLSDFLSLDQLSLTKSSPCAQGRNITTDGGT